MNFDTFFQQYGLLLVLGALLVFMFWSSRRRMQKQKLEQEQKANQTVPGAEVLLQGGLYGTIVSYDPENLDQPAIVELAPGIEIKVHSQAILRVVTPTEGAEAPEIESIEDAAEPVTDDAPAADPSTPITKPSATDAEPDSGSKPQA